MRNHRYEAFRRVYPDAPLYEYTAWIARAKRFAFDNRLGVRRVPSGELRVTNNELFTLACQWYATQQGSNGNDRI